MRTLRLKLGTALIALAMIGSTGGRAEACGSAALAIPFYVFGIAGPAAAGVMDLAFTIDDIKMAAKGEHPTRNDGIIELSLMAPQVLTGAALLGTLGMTTNYNGHYDSNGIWVYDASTRTPFWPVFAPVAAVTLWTAGLAAHGIWAIVTGRKRAPLPVDKTPLGRSFMITPTLVGDLANPGAGLACVGRF